jgi:hypothetical protein
MAQGKRNDNKRATAASRKATKTDAADSPNSVAALNPIKDEFVDASKCKYWVFTLDNGNHMSFKTKAEADDFVDQFGCVIVDKRKFPRKKDFDSYLKFLEKQGVTKKDNTTSTQPNGKKHTKELSPEQLPGVERVVRRLEALRPQNSILVKYKVTPRSTIALVIIRFKDKTGKDAWNVKPKDVVDIMKQYLLEFEDNDPVVEYALEHLKIATMRDNFKGNNEAAGRNAKNKDGKITFFQDYVLHTHIQLPLDELMTVADKQTYIESYCSKIGEALKLILPSPPFQACMKAVVSDNFWLQLTNPKGGLNLVDRPT